MVRKGWLRLSLFFCVYFSHMMTIEITGAPDFDGVITVAELKEHLRVDSNDEDTLIEAYRDAAIAWVEDYCNTRLGDVTAVGYMDYFYNARFPVGPVDSITNVTYLDTANASQTLATTKYWYDIKTKATRITFDSVPDLYDDTFNAVQINMVLGYPEASIPNPIITAIRLMVGHLYENRQEVTSGGGVPREIPMGMHAILSPYRIITSV